MEGLCTSVLCPKKPLPPGAPQGEPYLLSEVAVHEGKPVALVLTFAADSPAALIAEGEVVAWQDDDGRLLELRTARGVTVPPHLMASAQKQDKWVALTVPVEVVRWHRRKQS